MVHGTKKHCQKKSPKPLRCKKKFLVDLALHWGWLYHFLQHRAWLHINISVGWGILPKERSNSCKSGTNGLLILKQRTGLVFFVHRSWPVI